MAFVESLGLIQYPLWIVVLLMLVQIVRSIAGLFRPDGPGSPLRTHSILVLGVPWRVRGRAREPDRGPRRG